MNEALEMMKKRRSIRKYKPDMIEQDKIDKIVEAGTYAANGMNRQPCIIIEVKNKEVRDMLSELNRKIGGWDEGFDPFYGAPVVLCVLVKKGISTGIYDGSLVMGNLMLEAYEQGIGSCWIHRAKEAFDTEQGKELLKSLGVEGEYEGVGHCILGYVDGEYPKIIERKENWVYKVD